MFVIFGWGFTTNHVFGAVFPLLCPNCHNEQFWVLKRIRRWFTLFFIPIFPYESNHVLQCPICGVGREMSGIGLKRAKLLAETNSVYQTGALGEEAFAARLELISGASDAQVDKGLAFVASTQISPTVSVQQPAAQRHDCVPPVPPTPELRPAPVCPPAASPTVPEGELGESLFCVGCGSQFEHIADAFCPRCGAARPQEFATS